MTFKEYIDCLSKELEENPEWADKELGFCTLDRSGMFFLSVYDDNDKILIDIGTEEDDEINISSYMERGMR